MQGTVAGAGCARAYFEQPIDRDTALAAPPGRLGAAILTIIDESDGEPDAFRRALCLGYLGVSAKSCKGTYRAMRNAVRAAAHGRGAFVSAEDLCTQPRLALEADLWLAKLVATRMSSAMAITMVTGDLGTAIPPLPYIHY